ncbi:MAG TPA: hypothetical protein VHC19_09760 [Pirellulales bacterium]|jgi:hypothetical protein|nr:hypothetical protein [Pirellulales bacterium]
MSTILCELDSAVAREVRNAPDDGVRSQVWQLLGGMYPSGNGVERRQAQRYPYPQLITLSPVSIDGLTTTGRNLTVVGKHLSEGGLGFFHPQPLCDRLVIASLEAEGGRWFGFLLDIHRCRFTRHGWYESGGKFLRAAPSPLGG